MELNDEQMRAKDALKTEEELKTEAGWLTPKLAVDRSTGPWISYETDGSTGLDPFRMGMRLKIQNLKARFCRFWVEQSD